MTGQSAMPLSIVVMGVSGSGKSTIGALLAARLGVLFVDADDLHPADNVAKMRAGVPLTDDDRAPWLRAVGRVIRAERDRGRSVVIACSALRRGYRDLLREAAGELSLVYLTGSRELVRERVAARPGHFMPASLLDSQLQTLEPPEPDEHAVAADVELSPSALVDVVMDKLLPGGEAGRGVNASARWSA